MIRYKLKKRCGWRRRREWDGVDDKVRGRVKEENRVYDLLRTIEIYKEVDIVLQ